MQPRKAVNQAGLTMIELLLALGIVSILLIAAYFLMQTQMSRSRDARRKADLEKIKVVFEDYYNDNTCYPPADVLLNCNANTLNPYLDKVPCDPTGEPYLYQPEADRCAGYRIYARIEEPDDENVIDLGCDGANGCGIGAGFEAYNYGVSSGVPVTTQAAGGSNPTPSPSGGGASPSPTSGVYVCVPVCNVATQDYADNCEVTFTNSNCDNACGSSANWCEYAISGGAGGGGG